jgi:hypothetical protein
VTRPLFAEYLSELDFWRHHFQSVDGPVSWVPMDTRLYQGDIAAFWLNEAWTLMAVATILQVRTDSVRVAVWFFQKQVETADWSDYFIGVPSYDWVQIWPGENEKLRKVLEDAIAMEALAGKPLRAY